MKAVPAQELGFYKLRSGVPVHITPPDMYRAIAEAKERDLQRKQSGYGLGGCRGCNLGATASDWSEAMRTPVKPAVKPKFLTFVPNAVQSPSTLSTPVKYGLIAVGGLLAYKLLF